MKGLLLTLAAVLAGCACTAADCTSAVIFDVDFDLQRAVNYEVEACFGGRCERATMAVEGPGSQTADIVEALTLWEDSDRVDLDLGEGDFSGTHDVSLTILDAAGEALVSWSGQVELVPFSPNGPRCGPICWQAEVEP